MRKAIAIFMMFSTIPLVLTAGAVGYMYHPIPAGWDITKFFFDYVLMPAWVIGGAVLYPQS
jgi:hypothetical protein